jgi:peptide/nickel transport system permease protein
MQQGIMKKYFRVIVKPVALFLVFFLLVGVTSLICWSYVNMSVISSRFTQAIRVVELERLSNPLFLIDSLFTGNFGYSSNALTLVSEQLAWRLPNTLLLVGLSIITTALVSFCLSFLFKPRQQKPQVYAHSLRNFLFGSAVIVAILFLWILVYQPYVTFGSIWFPLRGLLSIPEPTDPASLAIDMLWHLALPVSTLTFVGVLRTLLILWSSGTPFADKSRLERSIYPITTIDFALFISAAILIEYVFTLPGLGNMLIASLISADASAALAASVTLLAIGMGLGILSTLLDFIQIFFGLRQNLEHEAVPEPKTVEQPRKGTFTFVKALRRRKSLIIGGAILVCFISSILPTVIVAPYDPSASVAESYAAPSWMTAFPQYSDYPSTTEVLPYWNVTEGSEFVSYGRIAEGSISTGTNTESLDLNLSSNFNYPYNVAPSRFVVSFNWSAQNMENAVWTAELLLTNPNGTSFRIWSELYTSSNRNLVVKVDSTDYLLLQELGYYPPVNLANMIFANPTQGEYNLVFYVSFRAQSRLEPIRAEVSLRDFKFYIPGLVHGVLGTDHLGRDVFSQLAYATGMDLSIALLVSLLAVAMGFGVGFVAGYFQGWVDNLIMVFPDVVAAIPVLPLMLVFVAVFEMNVFFSLMPFLWFLVAFTVSASRNVYIRRPKGRKFKGMDRGGILISIAKEFGANLCLTMASVVLLRTAVSFLGFGDAQVPSLGKLLNYAFGYGAFNNLAWWMFLPQVLCIALLALALLLVAHGLDDD